MKPVKVFLLLMMALYACLFFLDWLKSTLSLGADHSFLIRFQTIFLIVAGVAIMKFTLPKNAFSTFIVLYASVWAAYFLVKLSIIASGGALTNGTHTNTILSVYLKFTQVITPFPFFAFWLLNRVYLMHSEEKRSSPQLLLNS